MWNGIKKLLQDISFAVLVGIIMAAVLLVILYGVCGLLSLLWGLFMGV